MKYSLMSLMIDPLLRIEKPNFIHMHILEQLGYEGAEPTAEEMFDFFTVHDLQLENGTMTFEDMVRFAKESGFDGLDLMSFHLTVSGEDARAILKKYELVLSSANVIVPLAGARSEEEYQSLLAIARAQIDACCEAGAQQIMVVPAVYNLPEGLTMEQSVQNCIRSLRDLLACCQQKQVPMSTETLESAELSYCTIGDMTRLFESVEGLRYTHDTGNPVIGLEDPLTEYETFKDRLAYVHFKEYAYTDEAADDVYLCRNGKRVRRVPFGHGIIDFKGHLQALMADHYDGFINLEGHSREDDLLDGTKGALQYFRQMEEELLRS